MQPIIIYISWFSPIICLRVNDNFINLAMCLTGDRNDVISRDGCGN